VRVLIAEDDAVSRRILETLLGKWGYDVLTTLDGEAAWTILQQPDAPLLAILDVMMPGIDGVEICRRVRQLETRIPPYLILLTAKHGVREVVNGIEAGADDYLTKPYDSDELRVRLQVGARIVELQAKLAERVTELQEALEQVRQLKGILPICSYCKKIRKDHDYWQNVENYFADHSDLEFSHGICPACYETTVKKQLEEFHISTAECAVEGSSRS